MESKNTSNERERGASLTPQQLKDTLMACGAKENELDGLIGHLLGGGKILKEEQKAPGNAITPDHYRSESGVQCIDLIKERLGIETFYGFCLGNAFKYLYRCGRKDHDVRKDILKARWYLDKLAEIIPDKTPEL